MSTERPGLYVITHLPTGRRYVGSTTNLSKRISRHRQSLRAGHHPNRHLQSTWDRDGEAAFTLRVLVICESSARIRLEQRALDAWALTDPAYGFNHETTAGVSYGGRGRDWTPEMRRRQSAAVAPSRAKRKIGDRCPSGHVIDGTSVRRRRGATGAVSETYRCQECDRKDCRDRQRRARGVPLDWPLHVHYNRRGREPGG